MFAVADPLAALQAPRPRLAARARLPGGRDHRLGRQDLGQGHLAGRCCRAASTPAAENFNTEIGLPLTILEAPAETEVLVLEMAMRGLGQIAELCAIAEPDVAAITNVGPVHLELLGSVEAIAEAKAEILAGARRRRARAVVPADAEALEPHLARRARD